MIMTPSKTMLRQRDPKLPVAPEWIDAMHKDGSVAVNARMTSGKSRAWWDLVANMIVGRR